MLIYKKPFNPTSNYPTYPPYADGAYIEDYFAIRFASEGKQNNIERWYIPVLWTPYYIANELAGNIVIPDEEELQKYLNSLPKEKSYFVVSQHDDAPIHKLPPDTIVFSAGGNYEGENTVPIPLICSSIPKSLIPQYKKREHLVSFIGSNTHPIRNISLETLSGKKGVIIQSRGWTNNVPQTDLESFINITCNSEFCLCPRGYGKTSFRMYEAMQLGTIPVYVSDVHYIPWSDELDWESFCVIIKEEDISNIYDILNNITEEKKNEMRKTMKEVYDSYFSMSGTYNNIIKRLENL